MNKFISKLSRKVSVFAGSSFAIAAAFFFVFGWVIGAFFFGFTNQNYSLLINTVSNTLGFLMLFLIQSSQNTDTLAIQLKLDELIKTNADARNDLIGIEEHEGDAAGKIQELKNEFNNIEKDEIQAKT